MSRGIPGKRCEHPGCEQRPYGPRAIRCPRHFEENERRRNAAQKKAWREKNRARGYCTICGVREATPGLKTCQKCRTQRRSSNAVKNMKRVEVRRDIGREIARKVYSELGEMLKVPTDTWDPHRVRALGHYLASFYLYRRNNQSLPSLTYIAGAKSAVRKLHREAANER